jgi:hypothetical protein
MTTPTPFSPHHPPLVAVSDQARRLAVKAATAAELRAYQRDPDVVALHVERFRTQVDYLMWTGIVLGLCFTMTNVQHFAAAGTTPGSLGWWSAWLLDPMVSLVLLAVLRAEQVTTRDKVPTGIWPRAAKWALLSATYVMNTGVVLHSVPPLVVVIAAEALTDVQYALTECVHRAHTTATHRARDAELTRQARAVTPATAGAVHPRTSPHEHTLTTGHEPHVAVCEPGVKPPGEPPTSSVRGGPARVRERTPSTRKPASRARVPERRKLFVDYLADAHAAWTPEVVISPAWVRQVTSCSRGLSSKLAATLASELTTAPAVNRPAVGEPSVDDPAQQGRGEPGRRAAA